MQLSIQQGLILHLQRKSLLIGDLRNLFYGGGSQTRAWEGVCDFLHRPQANPNQLACSHPLQRQVSVPMNQEEISQTTHLLRDHLENSPGERNHQMKRCHLLEFQHNPGKFQLVLTVQGAAIGGACTHDHCSRTS